MVDSRMTVAIVWPLSGLTTLAPIRRPRLCEVRTMSRMDHLGGGRGRGSGSGPAEGSGSGLDNDVEELIICCWE